MEYLTVTLALHEALPGHHYEQSYLMEKSGDNPAFLTLWSVNRPGQYPVYSALGEGWASYCESTLSTDMGFFHQHRYQSRDHITINESSCFEHSNLAHF